MKTAVGVWIDHRRAVVVTISDNGEQTVVIPSNVEKQLGRIGGKHSTSSFESDRVKADDRQQHGFTNHLKVFYHEVVSAIGTAESVLIFGPGEGKGEFRKFLGHNDHSDRIIEMETTDKMTDRQIAAKVSDHFMVAAVH